MDYREIRKATDPITAPIWFDIINSAAVLPTETMAQVSERRSPSVTFGREA